MNESEVLAKVKQYYKREFESLTMVLSSTYFDKHPVVTRRKYVLDRLHEFCTISMFVQDLGVAFNDINPVYEEYYEKLQNLLLTF